MQVRVAGSEVDHRLTPLLAPRSIAIIGASEAGAGDYLIRNLARFEFDPARIFYVNPWRPTVYGVPTYARIVDVPQPVDLAVILVASSVVVTVLRECADAGVRAALVYSAGFKEVGLPAAQDEMATIAERSNMQLLGPNCLGFVNVSQRVAASAFAPTSLPQGLAAGGSALIAQSGGLMISAMEYGARLGLGFSMLASTGNQAGVTLLDVAEYLVDDPATRVIGMFVEDLQDGRRFTQMASRALRAGKPIVALKLGRSDAGREAAVSHTAALMGSAEVFQAAARQHGVALVSTISELIDRLSAFSRMREAASEGIAFLTISGGAKVLVADLAEDYGLRLAQLSDTTRRELNRLLPSEAVAGNPLDLTSPGIESAEVVRGCFRALAADPDVGTVALVLHLKFGGSSEVHRRLIRDVCDEASRANVQAAIVSTIPEGISGYWRDFAASSAIPFLNDLASLASLRAMNEYRVARVEGPPALDVPPVDEPRLAQDIRQQGRTALTEPESYALLQELGVKVAPWRVVERPADAVVAARELGFPIVIKAVSPQLPHKARQGGVCLNLHDEDDVLAACASIASSLDGADGGVALSGFLVQRMVTETAVELLIGTFQTPDFGPCITVGLGVRSWKP